MEYETVWNGHRWHDDRVFKILGEEKTLHRWLEHPCCTVDRQRFYKRLYGCRDPLVALFGKVKKRRTPPYMPHPPTKGHIQVSSLVIWLPTVQLWQPSVFAPHPTKGSIRLQVMPALTEEFGLEVRDMLNITIYGVEAPLHYPKKFTTYLDRIGEYNLLDLIPAKCGRMGLTGKVNKRYREAG